MKVADIRTLDKEAVTAKVAELRKEYFQLRMDRAASGFDKTHRFKELKQAIARCLTVVNEKK